MAGIERLQEVPTNERRGIVERRHQAGFLLRARLGELHFVEARSTRHVLEDLEEQVAIIGQPGERQRGRVPTSGGRERRARIFDHAGKRERVAIPRAALHHLHRELGHARLRRIDAARAAPQRDAEADPR